MLSRCQLDAERDTMTADSKKIKSTDVKETRKDRDNFRKGWDKIWGDKKKEKTNVQP